MTQDFSTKGEDRKPGRHKVLGPTVEFRVSWSDYHLLAAIASFERRSMSEFLRSQVNKLRQKYRDDQEFRSWVDRNKDGLRGIGIDASSIFDELSDVT
jgi:hypothetical protein